jgi:hypothetical protein
MIDPAAVNDSETRPIQPRRRSLLRDAGLAAVGAAAVGGLTAAGLGTASAGATTSSIPMNDVSQLVFVLILKYVTANYYLLAATGRSLGPDDTSGNFSFYTNTVGNFPGKTVIGGAAVPFKTAIFQQYADNIAADELTHLRYLRTVIAPTNNLYPMPVIDMAVVWTTIAVQAQLIVPGQTFNPFADEISFLLGAYFLEDLSVSYICGAVPMLSDAPLSEYFGALSGADAYHAGTIRTLLARIGGGGPVAKLSALRQSLSGVVDTGILTPAGTVNVGPFGPQALMLTRTPVEAYNILYLTPGSSFPAGQTGGFFPAGIYS